MSAPPTPRPAKPKSAEFKYNGGIAEFIKHLNRGKQVLHDKPSTWKPSAAA